jgi:hypothetical protein
MIALGRRATRAYGRPAPSGLGYNTFTLLYAYIYRKKFLKLTARP